jgi:hypothetical protein
MYAIINKSNQVEIYVNRQIKKIVKNGFTREQAEAYCKFEGLAIKNAH